MGYEVRSLGIGVQRKVVSWMLLYSGHETVVTGNTYLPTYYDTISRNVRYVIYRAFGMRWMDGPFARVSFR